MSQTSSLSAPVSPLAVLARGRGLVATARRLAPASWLLVAVALACLAGAWLADDPRARATAVVAAGTFAGVVLLLKGIVAAANWGDRRRERQLAALVGEDAAPCFTTDAAGEIGFRNVAAAARFPAADGQTLAAALGDHFANPGAVCYRLQARAANQGAGREDVVTRRGHMRLSVHALEPGRFLWRIEEFTERAASGRGAETLSLPMMVANKQGVILFSNEATRRLVGARPKRLDRVFTTPHLHSGEEVEVATPNGPVRAILAEVPGPGERREIYLLPVADRPAGAQMPVDFEHVPVALMIFRPDGVLQAANRNARDLLGLAPGESVALAALFEGPGRPLRDWLDDIVAERLPAGAEVLRLRRGEGEAFFQVTLRRVVEGGRPGVLAVLQDATALKTLEAQFVQSQKMQAIGQLAGGIAHDFNNLLTAISGHCDLLLLRHVKTDPDYADLVQIHQNSNRAAGLVGQLLAFSRKQTLKPERLDLHEVLSDLIHLLNRLVGERVELRLVHAPDLGPIRADKRQLEQVLMNLVVNARDAMPEGGRIRIETEALRLTEELRRDRAVVPAGDYAAIRVEDSGCGIPQDRLNKIFEPFYTTKKVGEGTGLGLSTVYGIVKQSGGFVFVDSVPGQGSVFHVYFPIHQGAADHAEARPPRLAAGAGVSGAATSGTGAVPSGLAGEGERGADAPASPVAETVLREPGPETPLSETPPPDRLPDAAPPGLPAPGRLFLDPSLAVAPAVRWAAGDAGPRAAQGDRRAEAGPPEAPARAGPAAAPPAAKAPAGNAPSAPSALGVGDPAAAAAARDDATSASPLTPGRRPLPRLTLSDPVDPDRAGFAGPTADRPAPDAPRLPGRQGEGVVLLVEDEAPVRAFASRALRLRGYTVLEAESAEEALRTLEDPRLDVDIFVTDVVMPGMDGPSWVRQALRARPNVRVIFVSGYTDEVISAMQAQIPNAVFLPKPFSLNDLTATVQRQFH